MQVEKIIITAMREEAQNIIQKFHLKSAKKLQNIEIFEGSKGETKVVLIISGIGKIQAAIATSYALENYKNIVQLINIGIAGKIINSDVEIGDVFIPNTFIQSDIYLPFEGEHLDYAKKAIFLDSTIGENYDLQKFGLIMNGICATSDKFIDSDKEIKKLRDNFRADICDMEAFAILSVAREYNLLDKCMVIKAISDRADNSAQQDHMSNLDFAIENSLAILDFIID